MSERNVIELVEGEPRAITLYFTLADPETAVEAPIDVSASPLTLTVHERDGAQAIDPIALAALPDPVAGYGVATFAAEHVAELDSDLAYVYRITLSSGQSIDAGDLRVLRAWR